MIRTAIRTGINASRLPLRAVGPLLPPRVRGVVELSADHAQAATELLAGHVLRDEELRERGQQRRTAARQRLDAVRLWGEAGDARRLADLKLAEERSEAARRKAAIEEQEASQRQAVASAKASGKQQVAATAQERKAAVRKAAAKRKAAVEDQTKQRRLEVIESEEQAVGEAQDAVTATEEAARLEAAAAQAKKRRKTG